METLLVGALAVATFALVPILVGHACRWVGGKISGVPGRDIDSTEAWVYGGFVLGVIGGLYCVGAVVRMVGGF